MLPNTYTLSCKGGTSFCCEKCDFICSRKWLYERHLKTTKHQNNYTYLPKGCKKCYTCECGKEYTHRQSLYNHKKICLNVKKEHKLKTVDDANQDLVMTLLKQNNELQNQIIELCKNNNTNITNNVNSHNKTFNLQVFLNEDCKDAMNVTQFIDSFDLQLIDFENVGKLGFVNGISDIIIKKLKSLDISERPIHCTDQKRQVLYAKVIDKWEKAGDDNKILRRIIKCVAFKNSKNIQLFRDKYPDCMNWDSKHADRYQILRIESLGGLGNEDVDNENKIIRKIAREILIDKNT